VHVEERGAEFVEEEDRGVEVDERPLETVERRGMSARVVHLARNLDIRS
jgi:hypothetical protein